MSITAKQLSRSGARGKELDAVVREQLLIIDDRLQKAERTWGRNVLAYDLPTTFAFPGLEKREAQLIIYSSIIASLQKRGFAVRVLLEPERTMLFLEWVTDVSREDTAAMTRLVHAARIGLGEVDAYLLAPSGRRPG